MLKLKTSTEPPAHPLGVIQELTDHGGALRCLLLGFSALTFRRSLCQPSRASEEKANRKRTGLGFSYLCSALVTGWVEKDNVTGVGPCMALWVSVAQVSTQHL